MRTIKLNILIISLIILTISRISAQTISADSITNDNRTEVDGIIAVVGKNMIKYSELETAYLQSLAQGEHGITRCDILEQILVNKLMLHQAQVDSIEITDQEVETELNNRIKYMVKVYGSQENLERQMHKSLHEIKSYYYDMIKENLMIQQAQSNVVGNVTVTPQEVSDYFNAIPKDSLIDIPEQYTLSQIVIYPKVSEQDKQAIKDRLNSYRNRILKGSKFSTLAAMYSDDEVSAKKGGELGFFSRGDMVSEFENVAFSLQPGEISPVFETKYGYHIIQMIERRGDRVNCRHILLQPKVSAAQLYDAKLKLDTIKSMIEKGEISFEDAMVKYSEDEGKINGGLIINTNNSSAVFSLDAINASMNNVTNVNFEPMKQGDITAPVEFKSQLSNAYRIIKVKKKIPAHKLNLTDDFDKMQTLAINKKRSSLIHSWAEKTIKRTYIKVNDTYKNCPFTLNWLKK